MKVFSFKNMDLAARERTFGWILVLPALILIGSLVIYPIIYNIFLSFFEVKLKGQNVFIGLSNYWKVIQDPIFWKALFNSLVFVFFTTVGSTLVGLGVAIVMNKKFPLRGLVRSLILFPYVAPVISVVFAWKFIFDPVNGIFMDIFYKNLGIFTERVNLVESPDTAIYIVILFSIWKNFPFAYLMILARLQAIDKSLYEAADIDGCNAWHKFRYITFPEIFFVMGSIILLRVIWNFNKFEEVFLLSENIKVLPVYTYYEAFTGIFDLGKGAVIALLQFIILIFFILFYVKRVLKW
jgi:multiple sugar transport system permease protein